MTEAKFGHAKQIINQIGSKILEEEYHNKTFGSWFITFDTPPKISLELDYHLSNEDYILPDDYLIFELIAH